MARPEAQGLAVSTAAAFLGLAVILGSSSKDTSDTPQAMISDGNRITSWQWDMRERQMTYIDPRDQAVNCQQVVSAFTPTDRVDRQLSDNVAAPTANDTAPRFLQERHDAMVAGACLAIVAGQYQPGTAQSPDLDRDTTTEDRFDFLLWCGREADDTLCYPRVAARFTETN